MEDFLRRFFGSTNENKRESAGGQCEFSHRKGSAKVAKIFLDCIKIVLKGRRQIHPKGRNCSIAPLPFAGVRATLGCSVEPATFCDGPLQQKVESDRY